MGGMMTMAKIRCANGIKTRRNNNNINNDNGNNNKLVNTEGSLYQCQAK